MVLITRSRTRGALDRASTSRVERAWRRRCSVPPVTLRIGIGLFTGQVPAGSQRTFAQEYRETLELVRLAEALGFDSAWVSEHHGASDGYLPSLLPMLAAFAAATDRIGLGTGVILTPLHDPLRLAEDAAVVDQLSEGRLTLGLGIAWRPEEFRMFGVPFRRAAAADGRHGGDPAPRVDRRAVLVPGATCTRTTACGHAAAGAGGRTADPAGRLRRGGDAARGRIGDGHITDADDLDAVRHAVALMEEGAREAGRDPSPAHARPDAERLRRRRGRRRLGARARGRPHQLGRVHGLGRGRRHARSATR